MQRPRLRLGLWWLMAAIAAIGLFLGAWIEVPRLRELSRDYRRRANEYAWREQQARAEWKSQVECLAYWSALATEREKEAGAIDSPGRSEVNRMPSNRRPNGSPGRRSRSAGTPGRPHCGRGGRPTMAGCGGNGSRRPSSPGSRSSPIRPLQDRDGWTIVGADLRARDDAGRWDGQAGTERLQPMKDV